MPSKTHADVVKEARRLLAAATEGRLHERAAAQQFEGDDREVLEAFNRVLDALAGPLNLADTYAERISKGEVPAKITDDYRGDFNTLKSHLNACVDSLGVVGEVNHVLRRILLNDYTSQIQGTYQGIFAELGTLSMDAPRRIKNAIRILGNVAAGDYAKDLEEMRNVQKRSEQDTLIPSLIRTMEAIDALVADATLLSSAGVAGNLSLRAAASKHQGQYRKVIEGINATLEAVVGPLNVAATYVDRIGKGEVPPKITEDYLGDFNAIKNNLNACIDGLGGLVEANAVLKRMAMNDHTTKVEGSYRGIFADVAEATNLVRERLISAQQICLHIANGDFAQDLESAKEVGKRSENDNFLPTLARLMVTIETLINDMGTLSQAAAKGDLGTRADASKHPGDFGKIVQGVNDTLDAVIAPVQEAGMVLGEVAAGDMTARVEGDYHGDHARIKDDINSMAEALSASMAKIEGHAQRLASSSEELSTLATEMSSHAEETALQSNVVSAASGQVSKNIQTVAIATEQMGASIKEIGKNAAEAARVACSAVKMAETTNATVAELGDSSTEIGQVIKVITSVAQQTNLLALNATIEAARAGEAGKGFAVVAHEVKELARETAKATGDISRKIEALQTNIQGAVEAIARVSAVINQINGFSTTIASAVEEQTATTHEIARNVSEAAKGSTKIAENILSVAQAAKSTTEGAANSQTAAQDLARMASELEQLVGQFKFDQAGGSAGSAASRPTPERARGTPAASRAKTELGATARLH